MPQANNVILLIIVLLTAGHLTIDSEKMSKSIGNVISVKQLLETHSANTFRHFVLTSHYTNRELHLPLLSHFIAIVMYINWHTFRINTIIGVGRSRDLRHTIRACSFYVCLMKYILKHVF